MASKSFFKILADIKKPTQSQIEIVRRRALASVKHGRRGEKLDAKSVEAMLRIVSGRYSDLLSSLESEYRKVEYRLDAKHAQGIKQTKAMLIIIEQDVRQLESMGFDRKTSGIDYSEAVLRLRRLSVGVDANTNNPDGVATQNKDVTKTSTTRISVQGVPQNKSIPNANTITRIGRKEGGRL